jgi:hypothetical protein
MHGTANTVFKTLVGIGLKFCYINLISESLILSVNISSSSVELNLSQYQPAIACSIRRYQGKVQKISIYSLKNDLWWGTHSPSKNGKILF